MRPFFHRTLVEVVAAVWVLPMMHALVLPVTMAHMRTFVGSSVLVVGGGPVSDGEDVDVILSVAAGP